MNPILIVGGDCQIKTISIGHCHLLIGPCCLIQLLLYPLLIKEAEENIYLNFKLKLSYEYHLRSGLMSDAAEALLKDFLPLK